MSGYKLTGEFQPNIHLDFGQGKAFSNKWAQGFTDFAFYPKEEDDALYVYAEDESGNLYNTEYKCPRFVMCIDSKKTWNIKVDAGKMISIDTDEDIENGGIYDNNKDEYIANLKNAGVNYYSKNPKVVDDLYQDITFSPSLVIMPQVRPTKKGGKNYGSVEKVSDGDLYTISVLPKGGRIILCSDKRMFMQESYYELKNGQYKFNGYRFTPDEDTIYYDSNGNKVENVDDYSAKFKVNGRFVSTLYLCTGAIVCLRTVVDTFNIGGVDTEVVYWEIDNNISLSEIREDGYIIFKQENGSYEETSLPSTTFANYEPSEDEYNQIEVNKVNNPDSFENSIILQQYIY